MTIRNQRVLVTGGAGFIGSHLVDALLEAGAAHVTAVDNLFLGRRENLETAAAAGDRFTFVEADAANLQRMRAVLEEAKPRIVFDLAVVPLPTSLERPKWSVDINVQITTTLCELAREGRFETLIHFSSSEALGTARTVPMDETHPLAPLTPYAASKAAGDHIVLSHVATFGLDAAVLRPFNNYGPRQNDKAYAGIIPIVIRRVQAGEPVEIFGDGEQTRDFIFVTETARAAIALADSADARGQVTNVASGRETSVNTLVRTLLDALGAPDYPVVHVASRPGDVRRHLGDITQARKRFGFQPQIDLNEGLRRTVAWYLGNTAP